MKQKTHLIPNTLLHRSNPPDPEPPEDEMVIIKYISQTGTIIPLSTFSTASSNQLISVPAKHYFVSIRAFNDQMLVNSQYNQNNFDQDTSVESGTRYIIYPNYQPPTFLDVNQQPVFYFSDLTNDETGNIPTESLYFYPASKITFDFTA